MTSRIRNLALLTALLATTLALSPAARAADPLSLGEAYLQIKDAERGIPIPTPSATTSMGTFDAATGAFDGLAVETIVFNGKPVRIVPQVQVNAVNARLVFEIVNSTKSVRVSVTGVGSATALAGRTSVSIDIGRLRDVRWTLTSGTKIHRDELTIKRPRIIGAGAFTIPALPVAVVYDPPQDPDGTNSVVYTRTTSIGTTLGFSLRSGSSTTAPAVSPDFSEVGMFQQQLQASAAFASATGNGAVGTALGKISDALGKAKRNVTTASDSLSTSRRTYTLTESHGCALDSVVKHLGPGRSDMIAYLRNARLVWLDDGFRTFVQLLGYSTLDCPTVDQLRSGVAGLDPAAAASLVALDPFAGPLGAKTPLATDPRFVPFPGIGLLPGLVQTASYTQQLLIENGHAETNTRVVSDDLGAGLLSLVGLAPSQTKQVVSTMAVSNTADSSQSTTVTTALQARTLVPGVRTELSVFYDRVFGNIAFQDPRP